MHAFAAETTASTGDARSPRSGERALLILATLPALQREDGRWLLPAKLVTGVQAYVGSWPGPVILGLQPGKRPSADLDNAYWDPATLRFQVQRHSFRELVERGHPVLENAMVLTVLHHELYGLAQRCRQSNAVLVVNTELTLRTQLQIARNSRPPGPRQARTLLWLLLNHRRALREIAQAHGLQCNGTPTFDAFARRSRHPLLYFDNRTTADMLASEQDLNVRFEHQAAHQRVRLLFSGRLHPIKGAHHLVPMADHLQRMGVDFELSIAGDGPLRSEIEAQIRTRGLQDRVRCLGTLRFGDELMPLLRRSIDIFVCPHLQGDPSCSYMETLSGGVPIVGYDNEAWSGLWRRCEAGVLCERHHPAGLAEAVAALAREPALQQQLARKALAFASQHLFETEFGLRMTHLKQLAFQPGA
jgi:colanic acid/amylovoran biosynthesis glycosyltransferase